MSLGLLVQLPYLFQCSNAFEPLWLSFQAGYHSNDEELNHDETSLVMARYCAFAADPAQTKNLTARARPKRKTTRILGSGLHWGKEEIAGFMWIAEANRRDSGYSQIPGEAGRRCNRDTLQCIGLCQSKGGERNHAGQRFTLEIDDSTGQLLEGQVLGHQQEVDLLPGDTFNESSVKKRDNAQKNLTLLRRVPQPHRKDVAGYKQAL
ncbi:hypothetical protein B0H10DRAFT_1950398 [Mycena sp. CBHHK59/15]|nr:hypothetical protein B0H10DRAFT_1950398 [Mycena sp. CBHHK59/15]